MTRTHRHHSHLPSGPLQRLARHALGGTGHGSHNNHSSRHTTHSGSSHGRHRHVKAPPPLDPYYSHGMDKTLALAGASHPRHRRGHSAAHPLHAQPRSRSAHQSRAGHARIHLPQQLTDSHLLGATDRELLPPPSPIQIPHPHRHP